MDKKKSISLIAASMIILTITATFSALQIFPVTALDLRHSAKVSPSSTILPTLPYNVSYSVNVTSLGADHLNETCIKLPTGWTNATVITPPSGWNLVAVGGGWLNFTTSGTDFKNGKTYNFSIPVKISMIPPTQATWFIYCYQRTIPSANNPVSVTVTVKLQFSSTMTPNYISNGAYIFTIKTTNDLSGVGIKQLNITFPTGGGWIFNRLVDYSPRTWSVTYDSLKSTFKLTGPSILIGESVMLKVNMTVNYGLDTYKDPDYWNVTAWDSSNVMLGTYSISAVVDNYVPSITIDQPSPAYYTVGSGNYIWINVTVTDYPSITKYGITVSINDTRFTLQSSEKVNENNYRYYFVNKTAIPDGILALKITAVDPAGNTGSETKSTTIDNTRPKPCWVYVFDQGNNKLYQDPSGTFWMKNDTTAISVNASFFNPAGFFSGYIYFNNTGYNFVNGTQLVPIGGFNVGKSNLVILNITLIDNALPKANRYTNTWIIKRDTKPPSAPSYTKIDVICGGAIIRGLSASDDVGIQEYKVYVNGTPTSITPAELNSAKMNPKGNLTSFSGVLVLKLTSYAGAMANITLQAVDYGSNHGPVKTVIIKVPKGSWYPIELQAGWNLISLPLVPNSTLTADIYALILKQGPSGVKVTYTFDNAAKTWIKDPTTITDGNGYFVYMNAYDVLIVQGLQLSEVSAPTFPRTYTLFKGWNLVGFTETKVMNASQYVESLTPGSYYRWLYKWNSTKQNWYMVDTKSPPTGQYYQLHPGQGFWIYIYADKEDLIPPIDP
jgi:hypothetical protein